MGSWRSIIFTKNISKKAFFVQKVKKAQEEVFSGSKYCVAELLMSSALNPIDQEIENYFGLISQRICAANKCVNDNEIDKLIQDLCESQAAASQASIRNSKEPIITVEPSEHQENVYPKEIKCLQPTEYEFQTDLQNKPKKSQSNQQRTVANVERSPKIKRNFKTIPLSENSQAINID